MNKKNVVIANNYSNNGLLSQNVLDTAFDVLRKDGAILMPVDSIYGVVSCVSNSQYARLSRITGEKKENIVVMVSDYKMLETICEIDKNQYDFLHKVWPGEVDIYLDPIEKNMETLLARIPKNKHYLQLLNEFGKPLLFSMIYDEGNHPIVDKSTLLSQYSNSVDYTIIVEEISKDHTLPTVIDLRRENLSILYEGRVSSEEIKSLYFLGAN